jgi:hypothetical protein
MYGALAAQRFVEVVGETQGGAAAFRRHPAAERDDGGHLHDAPHQGGGHVHVAAIGVEMHAHRAPDVQHAGCAPAEGAGQPPHHRIVVSKDLPAAQVHVLLRQRLVRELRIRRQRSARRLEVVEHAEVEAEALWGEEMAAPPLQQQGPGRGSFQEIAHPVHNACVRHRALLRHHRDASAASKSVCNKDMADSSTGTIEWPKRPQ